MQSEEGQEQEEEEEASCMLEVAGIIEGCSFPLSLSLSISTNCCILNPICSAIRPMLWSCDAIACSKRDSI